VVAGLQRPRFVGDPDQPPYAFAILRHGEVELMIRRGAPPVRPAAKTYDWDVYLRWEEGRNNRPTFRELYAMLCERGIVTRRLERMAYGLCEFEIADPDGYVLCLCAKLEDDRDLPTPEG
jgi:hypothetical protein